jgi:hypothetical protein
MKIKKKEIILAIVGGCLIACVCVLFFIKELNETQDICIKYGEKMGIYEGQRIVYNELVKRELGYYCFENKRIKFVWNETSTE